MKMQHFKLQARSILGPSKKVGIKIDGLLDEEDYLDELYGDYNSDPNVYMYTTTEGKTVMVNREYRQSMDIVTAYKSLKQAVTKSGTAPYTSTSARDTSIGRKGYLKMTIAAQ